MLTRTAARAPALTLLLGLVFAGLSGCGVPAVVDDDGRGDMISEDDASAPTTETMAISDPVENAFTVEVPVGWDSVAYSAGQFDAHREVVSSVSPDGKTVLFMGDPKLPSYYDPGYASPTIVQFADALDFIDIRAYQPAESYFPDYVTRKFGELPDFTITGVESQPGTVQGLKQSFIDQGLSAPEAHAVEVHFDYTASGETIHGLVVGLTVNNVSFWQVDVVGLATNRDVNDYRPMLVAMSKSKQSNPEFMARFQANTQNNLAQIQAFGEEMTRQHNANMAWIQQSAAAHQSRMEAIWAQGDASMQSYYDRMDSMDHTQRDFLNYINEEETVTGGSTGTRQVATGASRYYVNKYDGTYVGGDINFGDAQLRQLGLNPNDYEQVTIVK
ncbi:MAG: hypothetical protein KF739_05620 [Cryobacterium sp.]|nr:hypothetical protein [Cryobacterium sp.]